MDDTKRIEVRLEILKLVNRLDQKPDEIIKRAEEFEDYVFKAAPKEVVKEPEAKSVPSKKGNAQNKKEDNPFS